MIKKILLQYVLVPLTFLGASASSMPLAFAKENLFVVEPMQYFATTYFRLKNYSAHDAHVGAPQATAIRNRWNIARTRYDLYDAQGDESARAYTKVFGLGKLFAWALHLDIEDPEGTPVGSIRGEFLTTVPARFGLYDADGARTATAYVNPDGLTSQVVAAEKSCREIAQLIRVERDGSPSPEAKRGKDPWLVTVHDQDETLIDPRVMQFLGVLLTDFQNRF